MARALWMGAVAAMVLAVAPLGGQIVPGSTLVFTGVANATDVGTAGVRLDFAKKIAVDPSKNRGTFASLNNSKGKGATGSVESIVVGHGVQYISSFVQVGGYKFDLAFVPSGFYGQDDCYVEPVVGQRCTPYQSVVGDPSQNVGLSPFFVSNGASNDPNAPFTSIAAFNVVGTVTGPGRSTAAFFGTISSTFVGQSYQEVLFTLEQYGLTGVTFTGTFVTSGSVGGNPLDINAVPEPSTYAMLAGGLGIVGLVARRRRA